MLIYNGLREPKCYKGTEISNEAANRAYKYKKNN